jgi:hypothetical protein
VQFGQVQVGYQRRSPPGNGLRPASTFVLPPSHPPHWLADDRDTDIPCSLVLTRNTLLAKETEKIPRWRTTTVRCP